MEIKIRKIFNINDLNKIEKNLHTDLFDTYSPFTSYGFIQESIDKSRNHRWTPLILLVTGENEEFMGLFFFKTKKILNLRICQFLLEPYFSPDFILDPDYRNICIEKVMEYLITTVNCQMVSLSFLENTPNISIVQRYCDNHRLLHFMVLGNGTNIHHVKGNWSEFEQSLSRNRKHKFRKIERGFNELGEWRIISRVNTWDENDLEIINEIESNSWKQHHRKTNKKNYDEDLWMICRFLQDQSQGTPQISWKFNILELNKTNIAYNLIILYKKTAYMMKTSYDERYTDYSPGIFLTHRSMHDLYSVKGLETIDFLTDMPFMGAWKPERIARKTLFIVKGRLPYLLSHYCIRPSVLSHLVGRYYSTSVTGRIGPTVSS
jgi:hypothetical protein